MTNKPKTNKWVESRARRFSKSTFVKDSFLASCEKGESVEFHHKDYVCMSRERYKELITQTQQETLEMSRKIVTKRLEIWKENHIAEMADSDSVEWAIYNLVSDIDFDLMQQCQTIKQRKEEL